MRKKKLQMKVITYLQTVFRMQCNKMLTSSVSLQPISYTGIHQIPVATFLPSAQLLSTDKIFDLETTSLSDACEIVQITADSRGGVILQSIYSAMCTNISQRLEGYWVDDDGFKIGFE